MKRMTLIAAALCLVMLTTVGAGVVAAQQENLRHAGASHIYFYDVAPNDTHGTGKLQINVDKHTFVFNGKGFTPSAMIELKAKAADSAEYKVFATGKATPSGNLHIAGTWETDAAPAAVAGDYVQISGFMLHNGGAFVAQLACYYSFDGGLTWHESGHVDGITIYETVEAQLSDLGVAPGQLVKIHAVVVGGADRTGSEVFQYTPGVGGSASYHITGWLWNPKLSYHGTGW